MAHPDYRRTPQGLCSRRIRSVSPSCCLPRRPLSRLGHGLCSEQRQVEQFIAHAAVEPLDIAALHRLAGRDIVPADRFGTEFGPVIADGHPLLAAPCYDIGQFTQHARPGDRCFRNRSEELPSLRNRRCSASVTAFRKQAGLGGSPGCSGHWAGPRAGSEPVYRPPCALPDTCESQELLPDKAGRHG